MGSAIDSGTGTYAVAGDIKQAATAIDPPSLKSRLSKGTTRAVVAEFPISTIFASTGHPSNLYSKSSHLSGAVGRGARVIL